MKILADENIPKLVVIALRERGHDVAWGSEGSRGVRDTEVLARSVTEQRLLITFDKDFGELVWKYGQKASCGVLLFRIGLLSPEDAAQTIVNIIEGRDDWQGHFSVVDDTQIRMIPLQ